MYQLHSIQLTELITDEGIQYTVRVKYKSTDITKPDFDCTYQHKTRDAALSHIEYIKKRNRQK